jgi:hypothetical protein
MSRSSGHGRPQSICPRTGPCFTRVSGMARLVGSPRVERRVRVSGDGSVHVDVLRRGVIRRRSCEHDGHRRLPERDVRSSVMDRRAHAPTASARVSDPRERGWTARRFSCAAAAPVGPAREGMDRRPQARLTGPDRGTCASGDGPAGEIESSAVRSSDSRERGRTATVPAARSRSSGVWTLDPRERRWFAAPSPPRRRTGFVPRGPGCSCDDGRCVRADVAQRSRERRWSVDDLDSGGWRLSHPHERVWFGGLDPHPPHRRGCTCAS